MSLYQLLKPKGPSGFGYGSTAEQVTEGLSLEGRTILVTGCNSGLGQEALRVLALRGARVVGTARTLGRRGRLRRRGKAVPLACELSDPASVRACVEAVKGAGLRLDAVICNAGIMALPRLEQAYGVELQFFTNHIGHFMLVTGLLDQLAADGRVVMLSSGAHSMAPREGIQFDNLSGEKGYQGWRAYGQSKMANLLFAKELARRLAGTKRTANAVHPGVIKTSLGRHMNPIAQAAFGLVGPLALKSVARGAATEVWRRTRRGDHPASTSPTATSPRPAGRGRSALAAKRRGLGDRRPAAAVARPGMQTTLRPAEIAQADELRRGGRSPETLGGPRPGPGGSCPTPPASPSFRIASASSARSPVPASSSTSRRTWHSSAARTPGGGTATTPERWRSTRTSASSSVAPGPEPVCRPTSRTSGSRSSASPVRYGSTPAGRPWT
jgi:WW domain-containing oxidoreductase